MMYGRYSIWRYKDYSAIHISSKSIPIPCPCPCPCPSPCQSPCQSPRLNPCQCPCSSILSDMAIILSIPKGRTMWSGNLKGLSYERMSKNQLKISAPLPLGQTYRLIPLSVKSISLDSPFNLRVRQALRSW